MNNLETVPQNAELGQAAADYRRIAEAIAFIQRERARQPTLNDLAAYLALSPAHAQRLFSRWAGISPKRFLQSLTVEYLKQRMQVTDDLLSLAADGGLSGPGRLHDLFVTMEALSPGEFRRAGDGLEVRYGFGDTPFGRAMVAYTDRGICRLAFCADEPGMETACLRQMFPRGVLVEDPPGAQALLGKVFCRGPRTANRGLSLWVSGSNFQIQVWRALLRLPCGALASYRQIAKSVARPAAARAVGTAVGANPIAFLIPCHRVLRADGAIGGYHWGATRKAALVAWETARCPQT